MTCFFLSDLHLEDGRPDIAEAFFQLLERSKGQLDDLYILGDLFDVWIGDDESLPLHRQTAAALAELSHCGTRIWLMPGNRDFLMGQDFARQAGARLLDDPSILDVQGTRVLLMHGDSLCTHDRGYQFYRRLIRSRALNWLHRRVPLARRQRLASGIRRRSRARNSNASSQLLDINPAAAREALVQTGASLLIHGHTHRPGRHSLSLPWGEGERIVLGDWHQRGWYLEWPPTGGPRLQSFSLDPDQDAENTVRSDA